MKKRNICGFLSFLFTAVLLFPSAGKESIKFEHLSIEQGLSQNSVFSIFQDSKGFMWFGTFYGLNKYDGNHFTVYTYSPNGSNSLSHPYVRVIREEPEGTLWIGTIRGGLNKFDMKSETFTHFKHNPDDPTSLSNNNVEAICRDDSGTIWVGTAGGQKASAAGSPPSSSAKKRWRSCGQSRSSASSLATGAISGSAVRAHCSAASVTIVSARRDFGVDHA